MAFKVTPATAAIGIAGAAGATFIFAVVAGRVMFGSSKLPKRQVSTFTANIMQSMAERGRLTNFRPGGLVFKPANKFAAGKLQPAKEPLESVADKALDIRWGTFRAPTAPLDEKIIAAGIGQVNGKQVSYDEARNYLQDRIWDGIALGSYSRKNDGFWPKHNAIVDAAIAYELSAQSPAGYDERLRAQRMMQIAHKITSWPSMGWLQSRTRYDETWLEAKGGPTAYLTRHAQSAGELAQVTAPWLAKYSIATAPAVALRALNKNLAYVIKRSAIRERANWPDGHVPGPRPIDWGAIGEIFADVVLQQYESAFNKAKDEVDKSKAWTYQEATA